LFLRIPGLDRCGPYDHPRHATFASAFFGLIILFRRIHIQIPPELPAFSEIIKKAQKIRAFCESEISCSIREHFKGNAILCVPFRCGSQGTDLQGYYRIRNTLLQPLSFRSNACIGLSCSDFQWSQTSA
jgi:hypothetical protein